jgi:pimeloyl-ACP methyl ester carboxylesterase
LPANVCGFPGGSNPCTSRRPPSYFPYGNGYYSYVDAATAVGYATFETDKDTVTAGELGGIITMLAEPAAQQPSNQITVPVLVVAGADDNVLCAGVTQYNCSNPASVRACESQFYTAAPRLDVVTIPGTGHDLALSTTAPLTDAAMLAWSLTTTAPCSARWRQARRVRRPVRISLTRISGCSRAAKCPPLSASP